MNRTIILAVATAMGLGACATSTSSNPPGSTVSTSTSTTAVTYKPTCHRVSRAFMDRVSGALIEPYQSANVGDGRYFLTTTTIGPNVPRRVYESAVMINGKIAVFGNDFVSPAHDRNMTAASLIAANDWAQAVTTFPSSAHPGSVHAGALRALTDASNAAAAEGCF